MANNRLTMTGLNELRAALRNLPNELTDEATDIVRDAAEEAYTAVKAGYLSHRQSGEMERSLEKSARRRGFIAQALLLNKAPHAGIFESGSQIRKTRSGTRNPMPPGRVFVPIVRRVRREMYRKLIAMVKRQGLTVEGDGGLF